MEASWVFATQELAQQSILTPVCSQAKHLQDIVAKASKFYCSQHPESIVNASQQMDVGQIRFSAVAQLCQLAGGNSGRLPHAAFSMGIRPTVSGVLSRTTRLQAHTTSLMKVSLGAEGLRLILFSQGNKERACSRQLGF